VVLHLEAGLKTLHLFGSPPPIHFIDVILLDSLIASLHSSSSSELP